MNQIKIGIRLESLRLPLRRALREAQRLGATGVQTDAIGDLAPHKLTQTGRNAFRSLLRSHNLELTGLGCPLRRGLDSPEDQQQRIEHIKVVLTLGVDLGCRIGLVQAGPISEKVEDPRTQILTETLLVLGQHADRIGAVLALESGLESGALLRNFLDRFDTGGLGVNLSPANLLLHDFDPYESIRALRNKVVCVRGTDARRASASRSGEEVALGHGDIDWPRCLAELEETGYRGAITIDRESGDNRTRDVAEGVAFLRRLLGTPVLQNY